ncbi:MAG: leucine-rich repeat protein [Clostridia bacterium]|nr:leucine-rich repeat protein [Clostridia bacterium]
MAEKDINTIVGGAYSGMQLCWNPMGPDKTVYLKGTDITITTEYVTSVQVRNTRDGSALKGALVAGLQGALIAQNMGGYVMLEINWKDGSQSIAKMTKGGADDVIASSYRSNATFLANLAQKEQERKAWQSAQWQKQKEKNERWQALGPKKQRIRVYSALAIGVLLLFGGGGLGIHEMTHGGEGAAAAFLFLAFIGVICCLYGLIKSSSLSPSKMIDLVVPDGTTVVESYRYAKKKNAKSVTLPASLKKIKVFGFSSDCHPVTVRYQGDLAGWLDIEGLNNLHRYGAPLFVGEQEIKGAVVIPDGVKRICASAFLGCKELTSLTVPASVTEIGADAIPSTVSEINYLGDKASLFRIKGFGPLLAAGTLIVGGKPFDGEVEIPDGTEKLERRMYAGCKKIEVLTVPSSVTEIAENALPKEIGKIVYEGTKDSLLKIKGFQQLLRAETLMLGKEPFDGELRIPESALHVDVLGDLEIEEEAFAGCKCLRSVVIPGTVESINSRAFADCTALSSVEIEEEENLVLVFSAAFEGCTSLKRVLCSEEKVSLDESDLPAGCKLEYYKSDVQESAPIQASTSAPTAAPQSGSALDDIKKLKELLDMGLITQDEFEAKKKQILGL